jgi:hypothetical protein
MPNGTKISPIIDAGRAIVAWLHQKRSGRWPGNGLPSGDSPEWPKGA